MATDSVLCGLQSSSMKLLPSVQTKPTRRPVSQSVKETVETPASQARCELSLAWYSNWFQVLRTLVILELDNKGPSGAHGPRTANWTGLHCGAASENIFNLAVIILSKDCLIGDIIYQTDKYNFYQHQIITARRSYWEYYLQPGRTRPVTNDEVVITTSAHISSLNLPGQATPGLTPDRLSPPHIECYLYDHCLLFVGCWRKSARPTHKNCWLGWEMLCHHNTGSDLAVRAL